MSIQHTNDTVAPYKGVFSLRVKDKDGNIVYEYSDHNMIVNSSKVAMAMLVSENSEQAKGKIITNFAVGRGTTTATPDDAQLAAGFYTNTIVGHDFPSPGRVRFMWALGYAEANGMDITEFGLLCADGSLFARKVRGSLHKEEDLAIEGEWTIIF